MSHQFVCAMCGKTFTSNDDEHEAANAEAQELWGIDNASERDDFAVVCDGCFELVSPANYPAEWEKSRQRLEETGRGD